jgi:hypothetical protein
MHYAAGATLYDSHVTAYFPCRGDTHLANENSIS